MDPIADMLIAIKHGNLTSKETVSVPYSKIKFAIASSLAKIGFVKSVAKKSRKSRQFIEIELAYDISGKPLVHGIRRVSKPSRRVYASSKELRPVRQGYGASIVSTPKGILSDREARKENVGGEVILNIW